MWRPALAGPLLAISTNPARFCAACDTRVSDSGREAFAIVGLMAAAIGFPASKAANAAFSAADAAIGVISAPSASRSRLMARACSCDTRDSLTPSSVPMSFMVTSL